MAPKWLAELEASLAVGPGGATISTAPGDLAAHGCDWWPVAQVARRRGQHPWQPEAVVRPASVGQVQALLAWASARNVPVTPWGLGSGVTGAALPLHGGISLDLSGLDRLVALDETSLVVRVEAGINGMTLEQELNRRGYTLNHSPQSLERSTAGGWIATRATGQFSSRWGGIEDLALAVTVVLPSGELVEIPPWPRAAVGPDLLGLFLGSEGTLGVVVEVTLRVFPLAAHRTFEALALPDLPSGLAALREIMQAGLRPFLARYYDEDESCAVRRDPAFPGCLLLLGCEGPEPVARAEMEAAVGFCRDRGAEPLGPWPAEEWMARRFDFSAVEARLAAPGGYAETIEVADFWGGLEGTYRAMKQGLAPLAGQVLGHFSHLYSHGASLYLILLGQAPDDEEAAARLDAIWATAMEIALARGAAISHHHGIGLAREPYIRRALGPAHPVLARVKSGLDPNGILNPGKLGL